MASDVPYSSEAGFPRKSYIGLLLDVLSPLVGIICLSLGQTIFLLHFLAPILNLSLFNEQRIHVVLQSIGLLGTVVSSI